MDPVSMTASIIAVLAFTGQVSSTIGTFITEYRAADSELKAIVKEVDALRGVLACLQNAYQAEHAIPEIRLVLGGEPGDSRNHEQTDKALERTLEGLDGSMKKLDEVVKRSKQRMAKGGVYKVYVQALWQRTAKGIEKVRLWKSVFLILGGRSAIHCSSIK